MCPFICALSCSCICVDAIETDAQEVKKKPTNKQKQNQSEAGFAIEINEVKKKQKTNTEHRIAHEPIFQSTLQTMKNHFLLDLQPFTFLDFIKRNLAIGNGNEYCGWNRANTVEKEPSTREICE